jgi:hypothetical protein
VVDLGTRLSCLTLPLLYELISGWRRRDGKERVTSAVA